MIGISQKDPRAVKEKGYSCFKFRAIFVKANNVNILKGF